MTLRDWLELIVVLLAAVPGVWALSRQIKKEKGEAEIKKLGDKTQAETAEIFTNIASNLTSGMREQMEKQEKQISCLEKKQEIYERVTRQLIRQIKALGVEPEVSLADLDNMLMQVNKGG